MKDKKHQPDGDESRKQDRILDLDSGIVYRASVGVTSGNSTAKHNGPPERRLQSGSDPYFSSQNSAGTTPNTPDISPPNYRRQAPGPGSGTGQAPPPLVDRMGDGYGPSPEGIAYTERNYQSPHTRADRIPPTPQGYDYQTQSSSPPRNPHRDYDPHCVEHAQGAYSRSVFESPSHPDDRLSRQLCDERSRGAGNYVRRDEYSEERSAPGVYRNKNVEHSEGRRNEKGGTVSLPRMHQGYEKEDRKYSTYTPGDDSAPQSHTQHFMQRQTDERRLEFEKRVALATRSSQQQQQQQHGPNGPPRW
jgi:hypothetical protein